MARFGVYRHTGRSDAGYVVDVQSGVLGVLETRVVVPLLLARFAPEPIRGLNPVFQVRGQVFVMATQFLGVVTVDELDGPLESLERRGEEIEQALGLVLVGF